MSLFQIIMALSTLFTSFKLQSALKVAYRADSKVFAKEMHSSGMRMYIVAKSDYFWTKYKSFPTQQRKHYEVVVGDKPVKLFFDLEYYTSMNRSLDGNKLTRYFVNEVLVSRLKKFHSLDIQENDVLVLDSRSVCVPEQFEHIIWQM